MVKFERVPPFTKNIHLSDVARLGFANDRLVHPAVKIVILTAMDDERIRQAALQAGACNFVTKALVHEDLAPAIRSAVSEHH